MRFPRWLRLSLAVAAVLVLAAGGGFLWLSRRALPRRSGEFAIPGLASPIEVAWDSWGTPYVTAASGRDATAALGWLHADDRFFQMEMGRRAAAGRLSEVFGERTIEVDEHFRELRLRKTAERMIDGLSAESRDWLEAYAAGVNAWLESRHGRLPPEFALLGIHPEPWRPADSLGFLFLMANDLSFWDGRPEEERFAWLRAFGPERARELEGHADAWIAPEIEQLAKSLSGRELAAPRAEGPPGSNNWTVGAERSASGHPLVANDPHLAFRLPGVWYQVLLRSPDYEVSGMTLPGLPGVVLGRNAHLAWAFTNVMLDDQDLFFEQLDAGGRNVRRGLGWSPVERETERIRLDNDKEIDFEVAATDRGALLPADPARGLPARTLAWTAYQPGDPLAALVAVGRAKAVAEIPDAIGSYSCPAQNLVAADDAGHLLWTPIGRAPERAVGDGRFPSPGWVESYGWRGLRPRAGNPRFDDPGDGLLVTANADVAGPAAPAWLIADYDTPYRADRIRERLLARSRWSPAEIGALQNDVVSRFALEMVAAWCADREEGDAERACAALRGWNGEMAIHGESALFTLVERAMSQAIFDDEARAHHLPPFGGREQLAGLFAGRLAASWFDDVSTPAVETRAAVVAGALARGWRETVARFGADPALWSYGAMHTLTFRHPLGSLPGIGRWWNRGPFARPGSATTVNAAFGSWHGDAIQVAAGPSMRLIADAGDPEATLSILPGGESGHPADPHYADQLPLYLAGELRPVPWSAAKIAAATVSTSRLVPAPPSAGAEKP
jgi:penicillin amidase